jgi:hypothetical protein
MSYDKNGTWINEGASITIGDGKFAFEVDHVLTAEGQLRIVRENILRLEIGLECDNTMLKGSEVIFRVSIREGGQCNLLEEQRDQARLKSSIKAAKEELIEWVDEEKLLLRQI